MGLMSSRNRIPARLQTTIVLACIVQYSQLRSTSRVPTLKARSSSEVPSRIHAVALASICACAIDMERIARPMTPLTCILAVSFSDLGNAAAASIVRFVSVARLMPLQVLRPAGHTLPIAFPGVSLYPATHYTDYAQP